MNYLLLVVILGVCGGAYYTHMQDQQMIANLQAELTRVQKAPAPAENESQDVVVATPGTGQHGSSEGILTHDLDKAPPILSNSHAPTGLVQHAIVAINPDETHTSSAVDQAAAAAQAAANSADLGTITTLDNHTYTNCKVVKIDQDGVTYSNDAGITKIEYALMPPDLQKKYGYTPQGAVAQTEAEIRADQQQQAALSNAAPASP